MRADLKDEIIAQYVIKNANYGQKRVNRFLAALNEHADLYNEFLNYTATGEMKNERGVCAESCGLTAEQLMHSYHMSPIGAYNFMLYLREDPINATDNLKAMRINRPSYCAKTRYVSDADGVLQKHRIYYNTVIEGLCW